MNTKKIGSGPCVVFLHGFCEDSTIWNHYVPNFAEQYRVLLIDLPGFGSNQHVVAYTIEDMAKQVQEALHAEGVENYVLVGHSLGGYVALAMAELYSKFVKGLCMFHSTAFPDSDEKKQNRTKTIQFIKDNGVSSFIDPFVPQLFYHKNRGPCQENIAQLIRIGNQTQTEGIQRTLAAMRDRPSRVHVIEYANFPVYYIVGKEDQAVKFEDSLLQCHLSAQSHALFLAETAHMAMFERPKETIQGLKSFLQSCF